VLSRVDEALSHKLIELTLGKFYIVERVLVGCVFEVSREKIGRSWLFFFYKVSWNFYKLNKPLLLLRNWSCQSSLNISPEFSLLSISFIKRNHRILKDRSIIEKFFSVEYYIVCVNIHNIFAFILILVQFFLEFSLAREQSHLFDSLNWLTIQRI
jgi:hypothetical protein